MARQKKPVHRVQMTDGKRNIIRQLLEEYVSNQLRVPSKTKPRIVAGFKTSCNGLDIFLEFQAPREAVHPESLNLCHSYVWEFR